MQALGNSFWSMISGFAECAVRILVSKGVVLILGIAEALHMDYYDREIITEIYSYIYKSKGRLRLGCRPFDY